MNLTKILNEGTTIYTSGSTGPCKAINQPVEKIKAANNIARDVQSISKRSKIYTVCKLNHAGGLFAQTLPAYEINAEILIEDFNAFRWVKIIEKFSHSHLTPGMANAVTMTKSWKNLDLKGKTITCGSDRVDNIFINKFLEKDCIFIVNWGMSEVGPIAINQIFTKSDYPIEDFGEYSLMGNKSYVDTKIINDELSVKGDICVYDDWFPTGDIVKKVNKTFWYVGRKK